MAFNAIKRVCAVCSESEQPVCVVCARNQCANADFWNGILYSVKTPIGYSRSDHTFWYTLMLY